MENMDEVKIDEDHPYISKGFSTAFLTILNRNLPNTISPILVEKQDIYASSEFKNIESQPLKKESTKRSQVTEAFHITEFQPEHIIIEKAYKRIATKGVVQLFNSIAQVRKNKLDTTHMQEDLKKKKKYKRYYKQNNKSHT